MLRSLIIPFSLSLKDPTFAIAAAAETASLAASIATLARATASAAAAEMTNASVETTLGPDSREEEEVGKLGWRVWWGVSDGRAGSEEREMVGRVGEWVGDEHMHAMAMKE